MKVRVLENFFLRLDTGGLIKVPKREHLSVSLNDLTFDKVPVEYEDYSGVVEFLPVEFLEAETVEETDMLLGMLESVRKYKKAVCWKSSQQYTEDSLSGYLFSGEDYENLSFREKRIRSILCSVMKDLFTEAEMDVIEVFPGRFYWNVAKGGKLLPDQYVCLEAARDAAMLEMERSGN